MTFAFASSGYARNDSMRAHYKRGLSAYALGNYSLAASEYEKAFDLDPQPELLYDAAQAHRLAGDKARALQLYQSYLALFGDKASNRDEVLDRIVALKRAVADEQKAQEPKAPPPPPPVIVTTPPATVTAPPEAIVAAPAPERKRSRRGLAIGLGVAAGAIVIAGAVVLGLELGQRNPVASFGAVTPR